MMNTTTFILASNNLGKHREFKTILEPYGFCLVPQAVAGVNFEVNETGSSFEENAFLKASTVAEYTNFPAIADDSGLCVEALGGAPGIYSARFGEEGWSDWQRYEHLLRMLEGAENRRAKFVSCICCAFPGGQLLRARGECPGQILLSPRGEQGFGYDPIFAPEGYEQSFAELGDDVKNRISHRARALAQFRKELENYYADR